MRRAGYRGTLRSCETVTLTYITRMDGPAAVNIFSYTRRLRIAALPGRNAAQMFALVKPLYRRSSRPPACSRPGLEISMRSSIRPA